MNPNDKNNIKELLDKTVVKEASITKELETSFMEYAMSVIVARALPDSRDGLKPVHRRVLYGAYTSGLTHDKPYRKSAQIVGHVMGKYHPHGDSAIYETMVRMAQPFSLRYMLIDGHGNFGSIDGDSAAAMRYTEARLSKISAEMLRNIDKDTVDFVDNYDASEKEPVVLPSLFPNLLANGSSGIAVGMATNIPPHNLSELIGGIKCLLTNEEATIEDLKQFVKGPDFPTAAEILGESGINEYFTTGRGSVSVRAKSEIEELSNNKHNIIITEIPYMVNKANLINKIAELVKTEQIQGIADLRDESNRDGIRIVIETKRDIIPEVLLNQLYKSTQLQTNFSVAMLALVNNEPKVLNLKEALQIYIDHQFEILLRKTNFELKKAKASAHIVEGLVIATQNIDDVINIIKNAKDNTDAMNTLMAKYQLSELQAKAILDMRLRSLSGLERDNLQKELDKLRELIKDLEEILVSKERRIKIITEQLDEIDRKFGDERRTKICYGLNSTIDNEQLIPVETVVITRSSKGYLKRIPINTYKLQHRGGVGVRGMNTYEDDDVESLIVCSTHSDLLFFTNYGKVYRIRAHQVPVGSRTSKGIPAINLISIEKDEKLMSLLSTNDYDSGYFFFSTKKGTVKRTQASEFSRIQSNGKIAIQLNEGDALFKVIKTTGDEEIYLGVSSGLLVRFKEDTVRSMGRTARGVIGVKFKNPKDEVVGLSSSNEGNLLLAVSAKGLGKMTDRQEYRMTNRGSKGVLTIKVTPKTGDLITSQLVNGHEDLLMISSTGNIVRVPLSEVSELGRNTSGVKLISLQEKESLQSVAIFDVQNDNNASDNQDEQNNQDQNNDQQTTSSNSTSSEQSTNNQVEQQDSQTSDNSNNSEDNPTGQE
ncbi:DNA topoisomerase (ATP-hydrolyzing) subunit A [Mycoplasma sp. E35C]|uniref:DNA topoisomerase (ATP-hydrolyzing) subunit A n=1 Tax=Mycoplasma sp. E35C TaxID=2801918 RepID=UPI001CA42E48|nr:DNA topoisomerase (ATP-hydrolyzing) subunit A [Mycoplasma sp. E35C]QZX49145.1 DNA topoisomerase (ATP-hydrolyzing) subunit A [Mycoplasma sp. E35C]